MTKPTPSTYTYETQLGPVHLIVQAADIDEKTYNREARIRPQVTVTTATEEREQTHYGLSPTMLKVRGRPYTTEQTLTPAEGHQREYATWLHSQRYEAGHRHGGGNNEGAKLPWDTQAGKALDVAVREACDWLDRVHPQWRAESIRGGWQYLIGREQYKIEQSREAIAKAQARITELTKLHDAVK